MMKTYGRKKGEVIGGDSDVIVNLDDLCRLCLAREGDEQLVPIFSDKEPVPLPIRIMACVSLEVLEDDGLPSKICQPCHYQLEKYYVFRKKCESSDQKLKAHLKRVTSSIKTETESDNDSTNGNELTAVTLVIPEDGEPDPEQCEMEEDEEIAADEPDESISLPKQAISETRTQCTLSKKIVNASSNIAEQDIVEEEGPVLEASEVHAVAAAVRASLNLESQKEPTTEAPPSETEPSSVMPSEEGAATHVEVMTEDGSIFLVELSMEDQEFAIDADNLIDENGELKVMKCPHCPKSFSRKVQLKRHMSIHTGHKGINCDHCDKWFPSKSALYRHERVHTGEKPFECGLCGRSFAQKEILYRHFFIHSDDKPFQCGVCKKGFTQREALKSHIANSHTERPSIKLHKCELCRKVFCHASGLSRHMVTHTGRSYKCMDCEKTFSDKSSLRRHHRLSGHQSPK